MIVQKTIGPFSEHCQNCLNTDPAFINTTPSNEDFLKIPDNSPAKDAGLDLTYFNTDFDGNSRTSGTSFDIGAFEYQYSNTNPPENCTPSCTNKECGSDGCEGTCGTCNQGYLCISNQCIQNSAEDSIKRELFDEQEQSQTEDIQEKTTIQTHQDSTSKSSPSDTIDSETIEEENKNTIDAIPDQLSEKYHESVKKYVIGESEVDEQELSHIKLIVLGILVGTIIIIVTLIWYIFKKLSHNNPN